MLRKLNISLGIIALVGALFCGGFYAYTHFSSIENSKVIRNLEGGLS